jgi:hypothetical protein
MSGAPGPGRALSGSPLILIAAADEYLLELTRTDLVQAWQREHPDGELISHDVAPAADRLLQELSSPSLFASARLLSVRDASAYVDAKKGAHSKEGEILAKGLATLSFGPDALLLSVVSTTPPAGELPDLVRRQGELKHLPLPEPPKPWEEVRISPAQREVLAEVVRRVAPQVLGNADAFDALCEAHGFRPRDLAQAAQRLVLGGEITPEAARIQAGAGECNPRDLEDALLARDRARLAHILGCLGSGASLVTWRGEAVEPERFGGFLAPVVGRLLRQALAAREHANRAGLGRELDARQCAQRGWYTRTFKSQILPRLEKDIASCDGSPLQEMTAWQLHRVFRLAAAYSSSELGTVLAGLTTSHAERARGRAAITVLTPVLLGLVESAPESAPRKAPGG